MRERKDGHHHFHPLAAGVLACSLAVVPLVVALGVPAGASTAATPPSPLDVVAQAGQITHATSATEAQLLSLDASLRNGLDGTAAGYVYNLVSDAVQAIVGPLKDLAKAVADLRKDLAGGGQAHTATVAAWHKESADDVAYIASTDKNGPAAWIGTCWDPAATPSVIAACMTAAAKVAGDFSTGGDIRVCPKPAVGTDTVCAAALRAISAYQSVTTDNEDMAEDLLEASAAARATVGDAKDYPGNKLFEAVLQVLGEHQLTKALGKLTALVSPLRAIAASKTRATQSCYNSGQRMATPSWLAIQGFAGAPVPPTSVPACT